MNNVVSASDAVVKTFGGATLSDVHWLDNGSGKYGIGFDFDNSGGGGATIKAKADKCVHASGSGVLGRELDGDRVTPNGDDKTWSF